MAAKNTGTPVRLGSGNWLELQKLAWIDSKGIQRSWEAVARKRTGGAVMIIAKTIPDGKLILIRQFRPPTGNYLIEFPAGLINPGEDPLETAVRELEEETGYRGIVSGHTPPVYTSPGLTGETIEIVTMDVPPEGQTDLKTNFDETEEIETFTVAPDELFDFLKDAEKHGDRIDSKVYTYAIAHNS